MTEADSTSTTGGAAALNPSLPCILSQGGRDKLSRAVASVGDAVALLAALSCSEVTIDPRALNVIHDMLRDCCAEAESVLELVQ